MGAVVIIPGRISSAFTRVSAVRTVAAPMAHRFFPCLEYRAVCVMCGELGIEKGETIFKRGKAPSKAVFSRPAITAVAARLYTCLTAGVFSKGGCPQGQVGVDHVIGLNFRGMGIPSGNSLWAAQAYWACHALNSTATTSNPRCMTPYEMWYSKVPPSPFPFLKPGFVKCKRGNKLEPKAVPCFYIGPSPNRPRDSMRVMLRSGAMTDSRHVTWACIPPLTPVPDYPVGSMIGRGRGGSKTAELRSEEVESAGVESDASGKDQVDVWSEGSESKPVNVEADCGEGKMMTKNYTSSLSAPRHQPLRLLPKGAPRNCHR